MKSYIILRILWFPAIGLCAYLWPKFVSLVDWVSSNPLLRTHSCGYLPMFLIASAIVFYKRNWIAKFFEF